MSFFNQFLVPDQQEDELLDPLAAEYARRSSSRGATSIQPRSPVAATSATSSAGANPVPGSTALSPQLSPGWPANNPQISPAQLGQSVQGQPQAPISGTPATPAQPQPQPQSIQRKPPGRSSTPHTAPSTRAQHSTGTKRNATVRGASPASSVGDAILAGQRTRNFLTPEEAATQQRIDAILHPPDGNQAFINALFDPEFKKRTAEAMRDPELRAQAGRLSANALANQALRESGHPEVQLGPGAVPRIPDPQEAQPWKYHAKTGTPYQEPLVPEADYRDPFMIPVRGLEEMATGLSRIHENSPTVTGLRPPDPWPYLEAREFARKPYMEYVPGRGWVPTGKIVNGRWVPNEPLPQVPTLNPEQQRLLKEQQRQQKIGLAETVEGAAGVGAVALPASLATAPVRTLAGLGASYLGSQLAGSTAHKLGASPEDERLIRDTAAIVTPGALARATGLKTSPFETPQGGRGTAFSMFGGRVRGGVASSPFYWRPEGTGEAPGLYTARVRFGGFRDPETGAFRSGTGLDVNIPRAGRPSPAQNPRSTPEAIRPSLPTPIPRTQVQRPAMPVRKATAPSGQIAAVLSRPDISPGQKHDLIADSILGRFTHGTAGRNAVPAKTPQHSDDPADVMRRYMEDNGELTPAPKEVAPRPQLALDPKKIAEIGPQLAPLPHADQQGVLVRLHDMLSQTIAAQKKILGPDGQLHIVNNPAEAGKLAQQFINDSISKHDEQVAAEQQNTQIQPNGPQASLAHAARPQELIPPLEQPQAVVADKQSLSPGNSGRRAAETLRPPSSEEPARIDPNFRLDPIRANLMHYEVVRRQGTVPPYIRLDHTAYQIIAGIRGKAFDGLNVPLERAQEIIANIREQAAGESSAVTRRKLNDLARTLTRISSKEDGLSLVRKTGSPEADFRAIQEELFHSVVQRRPGKGNIAAGTPHEALATEPKLQKMQERIREETGSNDPITFVVEAIHDVWANEARELSPEEQQSVAEKYWNELANKVGVEALRDMPRLWHYLQHLAQSEYNLTTKEVMNDRAYQAIQRVIARRTRPENQTLQGADQPAHPRVPLQHRGRQETQGDSGEGEEPEGEPGAGPGEVERPPSTRQSVFLSDGRKATIQYISPAMKVARVRTADGQSRTIKLSELQPGRTRPIADMRNVPEMGHNMTTDAPSVRRAKVEAAPVRGQTPTIKVKQEPAEIQAALTQPPAPVRAADAARVGQRDPQSGRTILQPSNDLVQNERLANQAAPELNTRLSRVAAKVDGAKFDRLRPQKGLQRLQEKVADGKPANTIGDNLAAQIVAPTVKAKDRIIAELHREFSVISVDDKFLEPREKAGYPSANVQVRMRNGSTAEVQIVAPEIQKKTDQTHRLYTLGRNYPEGSPERAQYWNQAAAIHMQALQEFNARNAQEQSVNQLALGQRVVLKDGKTGEIVGFSKKFNRVSVKTRSGTRTLKRGDVSLLRGFKGGGPPRPPIQISSKEAKAMKWNVVRPGKGLPPYVALDPVATKVLRHAAGEEPSGFNATPYHAERWAERVHRLADQQQSAAAQRRLHAFATTLENATHERAGLNISYETGNPHENVDTIEEELLHSVTRASAEPWDLTAGVPVEELADHPDLQPMRPRLERQTGKTDNVTIVSEAMVDVAKGEAVELTLAQAERFARDMWQATAKYSGFEVLDDVENTYAYMERLRNTLGVKLDKRRQIYVDRARHALNQVRGTR